MMSESFKRGVKRKSLWRFVCGGGEFDEKYDDFRSSEVTWNKWTVREISAYFGAKSI